MIHLRSLLEAEVGLRIIYDDLPSRIAGMFAYSGEFGGVIAVNRKHPPQRRRATVLHEDGHLITDRLNAELRTVDPVDFGQKSRELQQALSVRLRNDELEGTRFGRRLPGL